jgi:hypothetical protein
LYAEAVRRGLHHAKQVLIVADGAVWIWNLAEDRFPQARQQLDLFHAKQHLWTVAHELHGSGTAQARAWVEPLLKQLENGQAPRVLERLEENAEGIARIPSQGGRAGNGILQKQPPPNELSCGEKKRRTLG